MMEFLFSILAEGWRAWLIAGILLLLAEGANPGTFALFFCGLGALVTAALCRVMPELEPTAQLLTFAGASLLSLLLLRPRLKKALAKDAPSLNAEGLGTSARVLSGFDGTPEGTVHFQGTEWRAATSGRRPLGAGPGASVLVTGREGLILTVAPLDHERT